jgi:hypothetical protein
MGKGQRAIASRGYAELLDVTSIVFLEFYYFKPLHHNLIIIV